MRRSIVFILFFVISCVNTFARNVSPLDFGLREASNGVDRFYALYRAHMYANEHNMGVDYKGIKSISVTIPEESPPIPLAKYNEFRGVTIIVESPFRDFSLFYMKSEQENIEILENDIDGDDFTNYSELKHGVNLLVYEDQNAWIEKRSGFDYGVTRRDIRLIDNGVAKNKTVSSYNNPYSKVKCTYIRSDDRHKMIKNITIVRASTSKYKVFCFSINGQNNVLFKNILIKTPENQTFYGDAAFSIKNSTNIRFENVSIDGTYSQKKIYGYGISMDNVWNSSFNKLFATGAWGVFGNYNVNECLISNSDINQFDIHCYGKNVKLIKTVFRDNYSQFSSVYGNVFYDRCTFLNYIPCLIETSFNAHVPFNLVINECNMVVDSNDNRHYLIDMGLLDTHVNQRAELSDKFWPNVEINDLEIIVPNDVNDLHLFHVHNSPQNQVPVSLKDIKIKGLSFKHEVKFTMCNNKIFTTTTPNIDIAHKAMFNCKIENSHVFTKRGGKIAGF